MNIKSFLNVNLIDLVKNVLNLRKKIDTSKLPSQGLFYNDDFEIYITRAKIEDIIEYEYNFIKDDIGIIIQKVKKVVENNTKISANYTFDDIKSIDVIFIFLEIVAYTKGESINIKYTDEESGEETTIEFSDKTFNYFNVDRDTKKLYDKENKCFVMNGYKYTLPTIGIENTLTNFLIYKSSSADAEKYNNYFYDFTHFLSNRKKISFDEIENLIQIFNYELDTNESLKIKDVLHKFQPIQRYTLIKNGKVIYMNSKIDLEKIFK